MGIPAKTILTVIFAIMLIFSKSQDVSGQTIQTPFGKNRVQYHDDFNNWWMYETDHFAVYWYGKGRNIVKSVIQLAELDHQEIQQFLAHTMNEKIRIVVYLDHSDYTQTNIAYLENDLESGAGRAQFYDNKIVVFFNGDHKDLRMQIRSGIAKAYFHSMFQGVNIQDFYNGVNDSELPSWIVLGLADYLTDQWNMDFEWLLKLNFEKRTGFGKNFKSFANRDPVTAGHSMWFFMVHTFGKQSVSDFLYYLRIHRSTKRAYEAVYNLSEREFYKQWKNFYEAHFSEFSGRTGQIQQGEVILKKEWPITRILADGGKLYYVEHNFGRVKLRERSLTEQKKDKTLLKYGYRNEHQLPDFQYPLISLDRKEHKISVIYQEKDILRLRMIDTRTYRYEEHVFPELLQQIYSFAFFEPGKIIMSASTDGFSDIYMYDLEGRQAVRITNDYYNEPMLMKAPVDDPGLFWVVSNHEDTKLQTVEYDSFPPLSSFRVFALDPLKGQSSRMTSNQEYDIRDIQFAGNKLIFKSQYKNMSVPEVRGFENGQIRQEAAYLNLPNHLLTHACDQNRYFYVYRNIKNEFVIGTMLLDTVRLHTDPGSLICHRERPGRPELAEEEIADFRDMEISESLLFQTKFPDREGIQVSSGILGEMLYSREEMGRTGDMNASGLPVFNPVQAIAARLRFSFSELITRLDNEPLIDGLVPFDALNREFQPQVPGMLMSTLAKDMFEDYIVEGGTRLAANFRGAEYFLHYHDLKRKTDWQYTLYRKSESRFEFLTDVADEPDKIKYLTTLGRVKAKYPFDIYRSVQGSTMYRQDEMLVKASDYESLNLAVMPAQRLILELAYIFDNTSSKGINLWSGMRYKVFAAFSNRFNVRFTKPPEFKLSAGRMMMAGFDFRYYMDVGESSTLAFRSTAQTSFGTEKNIYFLGGVENSFFENNSLAYPVPEDEQFAFMTQAGNLRGFERNARNGSSFVLMNAEFRFPVFRVLTDNHFKQSFLRDLQLSCFADLGTAWYGLTPFSSENSANSFIYEVPPAILFRIRQYNDPLIAAVGFGMRTRIFGYFVKLDYAWGIENLKFSTPMFHFSLGQDF